MRPRQEGEPRMEAWFGGNVTLDSTGDIGGYLIEADCPQLDVSYFGESEEITRRGLYTAMREKARAINRRGDEFPHQDLREPAELFRANRAAIRRRLLCNKMPADRVIVFVK